MENIPAHSPEFSSDDDDDDDEEGSVESSSESRGSEKEASNDDEQSNEQEHAKKSEGAIEKNVEKQTETVPEIDKKLPVEKLADNEKIAIGREIVQTDAEDASNEVPNAEVGTSTEAELLAEVALLKNIDEKMARGEVPDEQSLDQSLAETAAELGIEIPDDEVIQDETSQELPNEPETPEVELGSEPTRDEDEIITPAEEDEDVVPPTVPPAGSGGSPPGGAGRNSGSGNPPPPPPPRRAFPTSPFVPSGGGGGSGGFNVMSAVPNITPNVAPTIVERRSAALPYLVAGYLLGRRRGRIKTEKKLAPVKQKLEKEVKDLRDSIARREEKIRMLVREKTVPKPATAEPTVKSVKEKSKVVTKKDPKPIPFPKTKAPFRREGSPDDPPSKETSIERIIERLEKQNKPSVAPENIDSDFALKPEVLASPEILKRAATERVIKKFKLPDAEIVAAAMSLPAVEKAVEAFAGPEKLGKFAVTHEKPQIPKKPVQTEQPSYPETPNLQTVLPKNLETYPLVTEKPGNEPEVHPPARDEQQTAPVYEAIKVPERPKAVEAMAVADLLEVAARIPVEHSTAKKLYETNRLDEKGLRRVASAFLSGERYEKVVKENLQAGEPITTGNSIEQVRLSNVNRKPGDNNLNSVPTTATSSATNSHNTAGSAENTHTFAPLTTTAPATNAKKGRLTQSAPIAIVIIITILFLLFLLER